MELDITRHVLEVRMKANHRGVCTGAAYAGLASLVLVACVLISSPARGEPITMTVVYDNTVYVPGTTADWGFACMIEGIAHPILFDTGYQGGILLNNIGALQLDLNAVDDIVLSHNHDDHTGGLTSVLGVNNQVNVYFGNSFPATYEQLITGYGATPIRVGNPVEICSYVHSTGEVGWNGPIPEQGLIIEAAEGLVIITGCAHPDIVSILERAQEVVPDNIYMVIGGFHLLAHTAPQIQQIISSFQALGVEKVGPTHCTGDLAIQLFQQVYGANFITMGTGREIQVSAPIVAAGDEPAGTPDPALRLLDPSAPNPFSASTTIRYTVADPERVRVTVHDLAGRMVTTLADDAHVAPGRHDVTWDGRDENGRPVPSGVYFYCLEAGNHRETRRVTLVR